MKGKTLKAPGVTNSRLTQTEHRHWKDVRKYKVFFEEEEKTNSSFKINIELYGFNLEYFTGKNILWTKI